MLDVSDMAFDTRIDEDDLKGSLATLKDAGLLLEDSTPAGWDSRQFASDTSANRTRKYREKKSEKTKESPPSTTTSPVTSQTASRSGILTVTVTAPETETETESETETDRTGAQSVMIRTKAGDRPVTPYDLKLWSKDFPRINVPEVIRHIAAHYREAPQEKLWGADYRTRIVAWLKREQAQLPPPVKHINDPSPFDNDDGSPTSCDQPRVLPELITSRCANAQALASVAHKSG